VRLTENDHLFLDEFVRGLFSNTSSAALNELVGEAIIFLAEQHEHRLDSSALSKVSEHLKKYREKQIPRSIGTQPRESNIGNLTGAIREIVNDSDKLDFAHQRKTSSQANDQSEFAKIFNLTDEDEKERNQASVDMLVNQWLHSLPAAEAEALAVKSKIHSDKDRIWTIGIGRRGMQMLFRRACIRMLWKDIE